MGQRSLLGDPNIVVIFCGGDGSRAAFVVAKNRNNTKVVLASLYLAKVAVYLDSKPLRKEVNLLSNGTPESDTFPRLCFICFLVYLTLVHFSECCGLRESRSQRAS